MATVDGGCVGSTAGGGSHRFAFNVLTYLLGRAAVVLVGHVNDATRIDCVIRCMQATATPASSSPLALEEALAQLVAPYQGKAQCVAVASTGIIDQGILTALNPDNLGGLNQFPLQQTLQRLTTLPCIVLNDAQAAAWAGYH